VLFRSAKKRQERRDRNKEAAAKCRRKREEIAETLLVEADKLKSTRKTLDSEFEALKERKGTLEMWLKMRETKCKTVKCEADTTNSLGSPMTSKYIDLNNNIISSSSNSPSNETKIEHENESKQQMSICEISSKAAEAISSTTEATISPVQTKQKTISDVLNSDSRKIELISSESQKEDKNGDEDEDEVSKGELKRNNPMISGMNSFSNELRELMFQSSIAQRPTNLNLSNILLRQDSLNNTPTSFFNLNSAGSPSLNTPTIFALATVDSMQAFSPTQTRVTFILKS